MAREFYTIVLEDVGSVILRAFGKPWMVSSFLGRVQLVDVGKRVYLAPAAVTCTCSNRIRREIALTSLR